MNATEEWPFFYSIEDTPRTSSPSLQHRQQSNFSSPNDGFSARSIVEGFKNIKGSNSSSTSSADTATSASVLRLIEQTSDIENIGCLDTSRELANSPGMREFLEANENLYYNHFTCGSARGLLPVHRKSDSNCHLANSPVMKKFLGRSENVHLDDSEEYYALLPSNRRLNYTENIDNLMTSDVLNSPITSGIDVNESIGVKDHTTTDSIHLPTFKTEPSKKWEDEKGSTVNNLPCRKLEDSNKSKDLVASFNPNFDSTIFKTESLEEWDTTDTNAVQRKITEESEEEDHLSYQYEVSVGNHAYTGISCTILPPFSILGDGESSVPYTTTDPEGSIPSLVESAREEYQTHSDSNLSSQLSSGRCHHPKIITYKNEWGVSTVKAQGQFLQYSFQPTTTKMVLPPSESSHNQMVAILPPITSNRSSYQQGRVPTKRAKVDQTDISNAGSTEGQSGGLLDLLCDVSVNFSSRLDVGCKCSKTRCLKLYCDCFQAGKVCISSCECSACLNTKVESGEHGQRTKAIHAILGRRPDAFQKREKTAIKGCACKNSKCLKKYCVCFNEGKNCGMMCICKDCLNGDRDKGTSKRTTEGVVPIPLISHLYMPPRIVKSEKRS